MTASDSPVSRFSRPLRVLALVATLVPVALSLLYVWKYSVDVVFWDQWDLVPMLDKLAKGTFTFRDLRSQHNEHRILFPRLVMFLTAKLTGYDTRAESYAGWLFLLGTCGVLFYDHVRRFGASARSLWLFVPVAWMVTSLRQTENLLWGWQLQIFLCELAAVVSLVALTRAHRSRGALAVALVAGVVCTYSFASGVAVWAAGGVFLLWTVRQPLPETKYPAKQLIWVWTALGALVVASYLFDYHKPHGHPPLTHVLGHPLEGLFFYAVVLGASLTRHPESAAATGALVALTWLVLSWALARRRADPEQVALAIPFVTWTLLIAGFILVGRSGFNAEYGNQSRYTSLTLLGIIGAYRGALALRPGTSDRAFAGGLAAALVTLATLTSVVGARDAGTFSRDHRREVRRRVESYRNRSDEELSLAYPNPIVRDWAGRLETMQLNVFRPRPAK